MNPQNIVMHVSCSVIMQNILKFAILIIFMSLNMGMVIFLMKHI